MELISAKEALDILEHNAPKNPRRQWGVMVRMATNTVAKALADRKTGKWIRTEMHNCYVVCRCSECDRELTVFHRFGNVPSMAKVTEQYPYCHCGVKMEVDE